MEVSALFIAAHELTHYIRQWSPQKFKVLANFLVQQYGEKNVPVIELVQRQLGKAKRNGRKLTWDEAYEEMVADSMETMLMDGNVVQMMSDLRQQDKTLWQKICDWFKNLANDLKELVDAYKDYKPDSPEGRMVADMQDAIVIFESIYADALVEASENFQRAEKNTTGEGGRKYSFGGRSAETADNSALQQAELLAEQGVDNETIRQKTGWYKGMDGKWRYEIDDSRMKITDDIINYMQLGELMQHEELYAAYPDLANIEVVFHSLEEGVSGAYNPQFDSIDLSYKLKNDPVGLKDTLVHEIQHAIQHREGFTKGATAKGWERKIKSGFDSRRAADIRKAQETERELRRIQEEEPEFYRDMVELDAMTPDVPRGEIDWETLEKIEDDPVEWKQYDARREKLEAKYGDMKVWDMNDLLYQREQASRNVGRSGVELYFDTAGEIEARDASNRRSKTAEQRKSSPPRLGNEDTVFFDSDIRHYSMRDVEIKRNFIEYKDFRKIDLVITEKTSDLVKRKKVTELQPRTIQEYAGAIDWNNKKTARQLLKNILNQYVGKNVNFEIEGQVATAYLTRDGIDHSVGGISGPKKAAAFDLFYSLIKNAEYAYSTKNEPHSNENKRIGGRIDWDCFVSVAMNGNTEYPVVFKIRTIDQDLRSQIYEISTKNETGYSRGDGYTEKQVDAQPSYGVTPISENRVPQGNDDVNKKFSDRDPAAGRVNEVLRNENAKLKEDVQYLKDLVKLQKTVTGGTKFTKSSLEAMAGNLMKANNAKGNKQELAKLLNGLYEYIAKGEDLTWDGVKEMAQPAVQWMRTKTVSFKSVSAPLHSSFPAEIMLSYKNARWCDYEKQHCGCFDRNSPGFQKQI